MQPSITMPADGSADRLIPRAPSRADLRPVWSWRQATTTAINSRCFSAIRLGRRSPSLAGEERHGTTDRRPPAQCAERNDEWRATVAECQSDACLWAHSENLCDTKTDIRTALLNILCFTLSVESTPSTPFISSSTSFWYQFLYFRLTYPILGIKYRWV